MGLLGREDLLAVVQVLRDDPKLANELRTALGVALEGERPYTSDPRALRLPPGWSKRQWDDAGRRPEGDARRPPLRKDPRGYSCPVAAFDAWASARGKRAAPERAESDSERRKRQLANVGLRRAS